MDSSLEVKGLRHEFDSSPLIAKMKNTWSYTSALLYVFMA
jgi:hypothetical protein